MSPKYKAVFAATYNEHDSIGDQPRRGDQAAVNAAAVRSGSTAITLRKDCTAGGGMVRPSITVT
jgi:hypothetical protein